MAQAEPSVGAVGVAGVAPLLHASEARGSGNRGRMLLGILLDCALLAAVVVAGRMLWDVAGVTDFSAKALAPCPEHPFGTDWMGRDMLARTLAGLSTSVFVGLLASAISGAIALALALVAALGGRAADAAVAWLIDLLMGVPHMILLILVSYALGRGFWGVTLAVALTHWGSLARVLRAEAIQVRDQPYMRLAQAAGASRLQLALGHLLPALLPQLLVGMVLAFPHAKTCLWLRCRILGNLYVIISLCQLQSKNTGHYLCGAGIRPSFVCFFSVQHTAVLPIHKNCRKCI